MLDIRKRHIKHWLAAVALAILPGLFPTTALAQGKTLSKLHGHAQDPAGAPVTNGEVRLSVDGKTIKYTFPLDANGDYKGEGIVPDTYYVLLWQKDSTGALKQVDYFENVKIPAGVDQVQDFDMSREAYMKRLTPEQRKAIEDAKAKNAEIMKGNQDVKKLNGMLADARADITAKKYDDAAALMMQATQIKPDQGVLWLELGIAQDGQKKYDDAIVSLKKAIDLDTAAKKPNPEVQGAAGNALGEAYGKTNKIPEATAAYEAAAKIQPANAGMFYSNETIVLSQAGAPVEAVVAAADKAIAVDPKRPVPYYLKGQALINKATIDPKTQKIVAPPGTEEAYEKYLDLDPNGPYANDSKAILQEIGSKQSTKYTAGRKN
jgi:tetratricopeptide (TPR) repeat protein